MNLQDSIVFAYDWGTAATVKGKRGNKIIKDGKHEEVTVDAEVLEHLNFDSILILNT